MIRQYGAKRVVYSDELYEGLIIEKKDEQLIARRYYINEFSNYTVEDEYHILDTDEVLKKESGILKVREISRQLGTEDYAISEGVMNYII